MLCGLLLCVLTVAQSSAGGDPVYKPPILGQVSGKQALESHRLWSGGSFVGKALWVREGTEQDWAERSFSLRLWEGSSADPRHNEGSVSPMGELWSWGGCAELSSMEAVWPVTGSVLTWEGKGCDRGRGSSLQGRFPKRGWAVSR